MEKPPAIRTVPTTSHHGRRAVDLAALEPGVEAEVVRLAQELDRELRPEGHVDLALEVLPQDDLDDVRVGRRAREATVEHDRIDERRGIAGSGGDADEGVVAVDLGDADATDPAVGDDGEGGELVDELGVAEHVAPGVVDLDGLAQAVIGGGGAAGEGDAADGDRAHHAGQEPDQHQAEPARAHLGSSDGDHGPRRGASPIRRRASVRRRSRQRDRAPDAGSFARRGLSTPPRRRWPRGGRSCW